LWAFPAEYVSGKEEIAFYSEQLFVQAYAMCRMRHSLLLSSGFSWTRRLTVVWSVLLWMWHPAFNEVNEFLNNFILSASEGGKILYDCVMPFHLLRSSDLSLYIEVPVSWGLTHTNPYHVCFYKLWLPRIPINILMIMLHLIFYLFWVFCHVPIYSCGRHGNFAIRSDRFASSSRFCHQAHSWLAWLMTDRAALEQIFLFPFLAVRPSNLAEITL
jgi:hypothetical protein